MSNFHQNSGKKNVDFQNAFHSTKKIGNPHLLTKTEVLVQVYEEISKNHRSAIFTNSVLSKELAKELKDIRLHIKNDQDMNYQPMVIVYW